MKKILLIDDDKNIRESTKELLEVVGYNVLTAEDGSKGIKLANENKPDVIVCDIAMPVLDGYAVLNHLNKNPETSHIPVIFLTAKAEMGDLKNGMQLGADDYICKPFKSDELLKSIELRLEKKNKILNSFENQFKITSTFHNQNNLNLESRIIVIAGNNPYSLKIGSIIFIESMEKYSKVYTVEGKKLIVRRLLKEWDELLPQDLFMRIHKTSIINMTRIRKFEKWFDYSYKVYLDNYETPLTVSRRYSKKLKYRKAS
jgi:DNA-binding LytR/AlgR family response regulator